MEVVRKLLHKSKSSLFVLFFLILNFCAFTFTRYFDYSAYLLQKSILTTRILYNHPSQTYENHHNALKTLKCSLGNLSLICPANYYPSQIFVDYKNHSPPPPPPPSPPPPSCPDYFRSIYDDLWPWRKTGITREMVINATQKADFRLVISNGKVYVQTYRKAYQSRDTFTLWGILQLLRKYPGKLPDLELMFDCGDWPFNQKQESSPVPVFRYCGNHSTSYIVFPDWSFWGWPELNIKPWEALSKDLKEANKRIRWRERERHAYWKGNPAVAPRRMDLLKCNVSDKQDWNARIYAQDWIREQNQGFKESDLASQCTHRYKIYIEGVAWSVSEKYILACNSVTLLVEPHYHDFFSRSLMPLQHYWPITYNDKCRSIKHAVEWGNSHQQQAQAIGEAGSNFILDQLKMDYVYDYMFHLLSEYAKLLTYKPTVPEGAVELCLESMACRAKGLEKKFMIDSLVKGPALSNPCNMPPPYSPAALYSVIQTKENALKQVETWEKEYYVY